MNHQGAVAVARGIYFRPVSANEHLHIVDGMLSTFGINRILATAIEAGAEMAAMLPSDLRFPDKLTATD